VSVCGKIRVRCIVGKGFSGKRESRRSRRRRRRRRRRRSRMRRRRRIKKRRSRMRRRRRSRRSTIRRKKSRRRRSRRGRRRRKRRRSRRGRRRRKRRRRRRRIRREKHAANTLGGVKNMARGMLPTSLTSGRMTAATFAILDTYVPSMGSSARSGAGFGIGVNPWGFLAAWNRHGATAFGMCI
jgi:hypothetical protein